MSTELLRKAAEVTCPECRTMLRQAAVTTCPECLEPNEDPRPWCDCRPGEKPCATEPCRQRAHTPSNCPGRVA